ncbi:MAG: hypothetical protein AAFY29_15915 [Pseudomonadota bacterium]
MNAVPQRTALANAIASWDGKTTSDLEQTGSRFARQRDYMEELAAMAADPELQRGSTWLVLNALKTGSVLDAQRENALLDALPLLDDWQSRLHLLQCLQYLEIPERRSREVEGFVRRCLAASNKFVRAWAYSGFHELALRFPSYKEEAAQIITMALKDEAPSVKARIRQLKLQDQ